MYRILIAIQRNEDRELVRNVLDDPLLTFRFMDSKDTFSLEKVDAIVLSSDFKGDGINLIPLILEKKLVPILVLLRSDTKVTEGHLRILEFSIVDSISIDELTPSRKPFINYRLKVLCKLNLEAFRSSIERSISGDYPSSPQSLSSVSNLSASNSVLIIGSSAGGPQLVRKILAQLPSHFPPVLVVQHMNNQFSKLFAERLRKSLRKDIHIAKEGIEILGNHVYVAPGGFHMEIESRGHGRVISLTEGPPVNFVRPSVDVTIFSAVRAFGSRVVVVILSGMGVDGREGSRVVKKRGGKVVALRQEDSPVFGMNKSVIESKLADSIVSLKEILPTSLQFMREM